MKKSIIILLILCVTVVYLFSEETIEEKLQKFGQDSAEGFIQPVINGISGDLNSGFYNTAKVLKPFRFQLSINFMATMVPDEDKTFMMKRPDIVNPINNEQFYLEPEIETATIFGDKNGGGVFHSLYGDSLTLPGGIDIPAMPLTVPQFALGLPFGTEVQLRYFPKTEVSAEIGDAEFLGFGVKHSISQYIPLCPVDIAVQGFYQNFKLGDLIEIKSTALNLQASKKLLFLTFYGALGWEATDFTAEYTFEQANPIPGQPLIPIPVKLELEAENSMKATVGMRLSMFFLKIYGDYSFGKYNTANAGIGLGF